MKSIYKKISVGVLAAALLVGGSGVLQGAQAFDSQKAKELDYQKGYSFDQVYERERDRRFVRGYAEDYGFKAEEKEFVDYYSESFVDGLEFGRAIKKGILLYNYGFGKDIKVKVGSLYFNIRF